MERSCDLRDKDGVASSSISIPKLFLLDLKDIFTHNPQRSTAISGNAKTLDEVENHR